MTRTRQFLLAGAIVPAFALCQAGPAGAAPDGTLILAQQTQQDQGQPPKKQQGQQGQPPQGQQPQRPQQPPQKQQVQPQPQPQQQPQAPQKQQVQQPQPQPQQQPQQQQQRQQQQQTQQPQQPPKQQPPAVQRPTPPQAPAAQQPAPPQPPKQAPAQQQPPSRPSIGGQPPAGQPPAAQQQPAQPQPPAAQQPQPGRPAIGGQPPAGQPPAAQRPAQPQPPAAQQPQPGRPAIGGQPPAGQPPAAQQPVQPQAPAAQQPQPGRPAIGGQPPAGPAPAMQQRPIPPGATPGTLEAVHNQQDLMQRQQQAEEWRSRRVQDLRQQRQEVREGGRVYIREPGRTIVQEAGRAFIRHNEVDRFGFGARGVQVHQQGRETVTIVERPGGIRIVTVTDADGRLLRRVRRYPDGREVVIIDIPEREYRPGAYFVDLPPVALAIPRERYIVEAERASDADIYAALIAPPVEHLARRYTLDEIRYSRPLLERMPSIDIDTINFEFGSWEVTPDQVDRLAVIADAINRVISRNPQEVFLIEGHTDAVGSDVDNLSLSDRRAEAVALVLTDRFQVPPENLTTQGYGKQYLKIASDGPERRNRRVTVRRITPLLAGTD